LELLLTRRGLDEQGGAKRSRAGSRAVAVSASGWTATSAADSTNSSEQGVDGEAPAVSGSTRRRAREKEREREEGAQWGGRENGLGWLLFIERREEEKRRGGEKTAAVPSKRH
jgi:hypothetical protein